MQVSQSVKFAALIVVLVVFYFLVRGLFAGDDNVIETANDDIFTVVTQTVTPKEWQAEIVIRGRTAALRKVIVRSEIAGAVAETPTVEGALVEKGAVLCQIEVNARQAELAEARASLRKARLDYDAAVKLNKDGFRSETAVAAAEAAFDLAAANEERAGITFGKTKVTAPFDGVFDNRNVEIGDFMKVGDACGTVIQRSPFLVVGAVAEKDVAKIEQGDRGVARLATGETVTGTVRLVGAAADPATRTFTVELEVPNEDGKLLDGVTADFTVFAQKRAAYLIPRSSLTLNDGGSIGIRSIEAQNKVLFTPVRLLGEEAEGVWVDGLNGSINLIVRGQDFVSAGQVVDAVDVQSLNKSPDS